ncbi:TetR family transcriptional regulator [Nocardioides sp.]|uniref:TetR/AcrR family transcriptional regulator n=1 Tax=Nocardioides sp. TaxID=35761 RepID=UPI003D0E6F83
MPSTPRSTSDSRRAGRRGASSTARDDISRAAVEVFAERGYDNAGLRQIADRAGVDPALINYFFGSKAELFAEVVGLPFRPADVLPGILDGDPDGIGERLATFVVAALADPGRRNTIVGMIRSAASHEVAAVMVRDKVTRELLLPIAAHLGSDRAEVRAGLAMSQVVGLAFARHVVGLEVLNTASQDALVAALAPTLQRYLAGDLDG